MWTLAIGVIVIFLVYDWWCHQYFKRLGIPVAPYYPVIGNAHQWLSKGNNNFGEECVRKYGKVVGIYKFRSPLLYVSDKNIVKRVLVTDFNKFPSHWDIPALGFPLDKSLTYMKGQQWKDVRTIMTASFTASKLKQMVGIFNGICDPLLENIANAHVHNKPIDAKKVFLGYALQNISAIFLGLDISCQTNLDHPFVRRIQGAFSPSLFTLIPILFPWLGPLFELMGANIIPKESVAFFKKVIHQSLEGGDMIRQCGGGNGLNKYTAIVEELYRHTDLPANLPIPEETGKPKRLTYEEFFAANRPRMFGDCDVWQVHSAEGTGGPYPGLFGAT